MKFYEFAEKVLHEAQMGKNIAKLFIGDPDLEPPRRLVQAAMQSLRKNEVKYVSSKGDLRLRKKIAEQHGIGDAERVVVTPGSKFAIFAAVKILAEKKQQANGKPNACILSPHWPGFSAICQANGVEARLVKSSFESEWQPDLKVLEKAIDRDTILVIAANPNNPTSTVIESANLQKLYELCRKRKVPFLLDEAYQGLAFEKMPVSKEAASQGNLIAGSFSKSFMMTGFRIGFLIANDTGFAGKVVSLAQATYSCVPQFVQEAALETFKLHRESEKAKRIYKERAALACKILEGEMDFVKPRAGFYLFAGRKGLDSGRFCINLLEKGVAIAPGSDFGFNEFVRISLTQEKKALEKSLNVIKNEIRKEGKSHNRK